MTNRFGRIVGAALFGLAVILTGRPTPVSAEPAVMLDRLVEYSIILGPVIGTLKDLEADDKVQAEALTETMIAAMEEARLIVEALGQDGNQALCNNENIETAMLSIGRSLAMVLNGSVNLFDTPVAARLDALHAALDAEIETAKAGC